MSPDRSLRIRSDADIVVARQEGRAVASEVGFTGSALTIIATAISEVARNIVSYAGEGEIVLRALEEGNRRGILIVARDDGPGISDVARAARMQ